VFVQCTLWREAAQHAAASLAKGTRVIAAGTLTERTYWAKDGQRRTSAELDVDELGASLRFAPIPRGFGESEGRAGRNRRGDPGR
jgi:single-strand DNA-binding protein